MLPRPFRERISKRDCISIVKPARCINVSNLFYWSNTVHVSEGLSVNHHELKTVHTATGMSNMSNRYCRLLASKQSAVSV